MAKGKPRLFDNELKWRIASALVMASVVLLVTWIGGKTFSLLWAVLGLAIYYEFSKMVRTETGLFHTLAGLAGLFLIFFAYHTDQVALALKISVIGTLAMVIWEMVVRRKVWSSLGFVYAAFTFLAMSDLRGEDWAGLLVILVLFACVWGADVFAYFSGRLIGGPKLAPAISPKKTWAGFIGGITGAVILSCAVISVANHSITMGFILVILAVATLSQIGDLMESSMKRRFNIKDSGTIIPGHGGILDRVDGLIVSAVTLWLGLLLMTIWSKSTVTAGGMFERLFLQ